MNQEEHAGVFKPRLFVYGTGGHSKVVIEVIKRQGRYNLVGLLDDDPPTAESMRQGVPILGGREKLGELQMAGVRHCFVAVGENEVRHRIMGELVERGFEPAIVVDPTTVVLSEASIGPGTLILAFSHVGVDVTLGQGCIVSVGCVVGHDSCLGDYVHLTPGVRLGGSVTIGEESLLGLGAVVLPEVRIGRRVTVGAGAAVIRDLPDGVVAAGVPAKILRKNR